MMKSKMKQVSLFTIFILLTVTLTVGSAYATTITVGTEPVGVAFDSNKDEVFVANFGSNRVSVISDATNKVTATITVGTQPDWVGFDSHLNEVFVANWGAGNTVSVISDATNKVTATITVGSGPDGVGFDSHLNEVFVANTGSNTVSVLPG
jgi:YVTN family beta-propeller protein